MDTGRAILRWTIGPLFVGHGMQKLGGWFGGHGLEGTASFFEGLGLRPGRRHAAAAGAAETAGGVLLTLGFLTPVAASLLTGVMVTAIRRVHGKNGVWNTAGGFEYNAVVIGALAALAEQGPGRPSLDAAALPRLRGPMWALASIGAGAAGSYLSERLLVEPGPQPASAATVPTAADEPLAGGGEGGDGSQGGGEASRGAEGEPAAEPARAKASSR
jgi:putative oxidoreductase